MNKWSLRTFRNDLSIFVEKIKDNNIPGDFQPLENLLNNLDDLTLLNYTLENVCFYIKKFLRGTTPNTICNFELFFDNKLFLKDDFNLDDDPLYRYKFELNIKGYTNSNKSGKEYKNCWHLDRHYSDDVTHNTHPSYHFHFGGKKVNGISSGDLMILSAPRLPHPPMDIFLSFHFIISNFFDVGRDPIRSLLEDEEYKIIIQRARERLWKPYFSAFDSSCTHTDFTISKIFPLLMT